MDSKGCASFCGNGKNTVVGWCDVSPSDRPVCAHAGTLGMGVIAEHRGCGIGNALIQATLEKAKAQGLARIELDVREENHRAIKLYEKFGFKIEGLKRNAARIDSNYSNDYLMALLILMPPKQKQGIEIL